jgi:hypothetical protein
VPVPTEYGAYAVVGGRLIGLEQLAIRVPDPRVAISAAFALPSNSHLSSNPNEFVVFRKDLLNGAPDRAAVRVVAQVANALYSKFSEYCGSVWVCCKHFLCWAARNSSPFSQVQRVSIRLLSGSL